MSAAIYYHPEAYTTSGPKLMGRNAAGESFLRGFLSHGKATEFWVQVQSSEHARDFAATARAQGRNEPVHAVERHDLGKLVRPGAIFFPGPGIGQHAFHRALFGHNTWSLCGITHTTSSAGAMDALVDLVVAPVQPWDAVICTSTAVRDNVVRLLEAQAEYLRERLGVTRQVLPQLPVIPLGVHAEDFAFDVARRAAARSTIGAGEDDLVVLFMGRLSFHAKAHPLAMYQALEKATQATGKQVVLLECGWHANEFIEKAFAEGARQACPSVRVVVLDGRKAEQRETAWAGADVFCSLADNIQETFGIVPIEAMAAGLPVVVSDWDGYKDTVRDGIDGFRIPTLMPEAGLGGDLAMRHALEIDSYDRYCGYACSLVAVDIEAAARAFGELFGSPDLRRRMGETGRRRAQEVFDWVNIIPQYEILWAELGELRRVQAAGRLPYPWPARMDPFDAFAGYPTRTLTPETVVALVDTEAALAIRRIKTYRSLAMVDFAAAVLPSAEMIETLADRLATAPCTAGALAGQFPAGQRSFVFRALCWLIKLGIIRTSP